MVQLSSGQLADFSPSFRHKQVFLRCHFLKGLPSSCCIMQLKYRGAHQVPLQNHTSACKHGRTTVLWESEVAAGGQQFTAAANPSVTMPWGWCKVALDWIVTVATASSCVLHRTLWSTIGFGRWRVVQKCYVVFVHLIENSRLAAVLLICVCTVSLMLLKWHKICACQQYSAVSCFSGYALGMSYGKQTLSAFSSEFVWPAVAKSLGMTLLPMLICLDWPLKGLCPSLYNQKGNNDIM